MNKTIFFVDKKFPFSGDFDLSFCIYNTNFSVKTIRNFYFTDTK